MANGNPWFSAVEQTLPQYVPLPFQELAAAGQAVQSRYDTAMAGLEETATGLASIEARLPGHRQYVSDFANRYRTEADELLSRYNYNAADPQFSRELTRLRSRYANDPNLRTILMANEADKRNAELSARMAAEGRLFINPQATGVDSEGRIINDVGQVRGVNTLEDWANRLKIAAGSKTEYGNMIGNRPNLEIAGKQILESIAQGSPESQDLVSAYMSQGMSQQQAQQQAMVDAQRLIGEYAVSEGTNWQKLNYGLNVAKAKEQAKVAAQPQLIRQQAALLGDNVNKNLLDRVDTLIDNLDSSGKLLGRAQQVENTEENRRKYPNARPRIIGGGPGYGGLGNYSDVLRIPKSGEPSAEDREFIQAATDEISPILEAKGINPNEASDETKLKVYQEYLKQDNKAPIFWNHPVKEVREGLLYIFAGDNGAGLQNAVLIDEDGKNKRVSDGVEIGNYDGFTFGGIGAAPIKDDLINLETGSVRINAVNKNSKELVSFLVPLTENMKESVPTVNLVSRVTSSGLNNTELRKNPSYRFGEFVNPSTGQRTSLAPQKKAGRVEFYPVDDQGNITGEKVDDQQLMMLMQSELQNLQLQMENMQNTH